MDTKPSQIISSGAQHSVQLGLDNKNAQRRRNVVNSQEPELVPTAMANDTETQRGHAQLREGEETTLAIRGDQIDLAPEAETALNGKNAFIGEGAGRPEGHMAFAAEETTQAKAASALGVNEVSVVSTGLSATEADRADRFLGGSGVQGSEDELQGQKELAGRDTDARFDKDQPLQDRWLSGDEGRTENRELGVKKDPLGHDQTLSGQEGAATDHEARFKKDPASVDGGLSGREEALADRDGRGAKTGVQADRDVSAAEAVPLDNRQKIEALSGAAERIKLLTQGLGGGPGRADQPLDVARALAELQGEEAVEAPAAEPEEIPVALPEPVLEAPPELPPELAMNTRVMTPEEIADSEFEARMKALKTNMTVTDGILTQLQKSPPSV